MIGKSIFIDHGTGVVIGETAALGDHVKLYQGVGLVARSLAAGQALRGSQPSDELWNNAGAAASAGLSPSSDIHASGGQPDRAREMAPMVPMQRAGSADEVAHNIVWLLSPDASYTTGAILDVAGGR